MNQSRWLLGVSADDSNVARGFVSAFLAALVLVVMITCVAVASDPAPTEAESAQDFEDPTGSKTDFADELKSRIRDRFAFYDPSRGTQPTEQGFRLLDNARGHANPQVTAGVLKQGPTTTKGYQRWYTAAIPIDFSAEGKGTAVEWTAQVKRSGLYIDRSRKREWTGWGVQLQDKNGYTFDIYLGEDRVLLNRDDGNMPIATHKLDTTDRFHHYRFVIDDSQGMLFIDGSSEPAVVGKVGSPNQSRYSKPNEVAFGDCTTNAFSEVHVKGLWYASNAQAKSPFYVAPKPPTALLYDASRGTLPSEQGFQLVDDDPNHAPVCIEEGKLIDGPTTTKGMRCWQSHRIPLDFRPQGSGLSAEWKVQVVDSRVDSTGHYSGWSASFVDGYGQQFLIGLGNDRIVLHNMTRDPNPAVAQFQTTGSVHHFRFVVDDNQGILHVDGKRLLSKPNGTPDKRKILANRVLFGDGTGNAGAHTKLLGFGYSADARAAFTFHPFQMTNAKQVAQKLNQSLILHYPLDKKRNDRVVPDESDHGNNAIEHVRSEMTDGLHQPTCADDVEAFHLAVAKGEATTVERMLSRDAALANRRSQNKFTPLFQAALPGHTKVAKLLLQSGAKVDDRVLGETPLFRACHDGHTETAKLLLDHGADIDAVCNDETPLYIAINRLHASTVRLLLDRGADPNWIHIHPDAPRASNDKGPVPLLEALARVRWATHHLARKKTEGDKDRIAYYEKTKKTAEAIAMMFLTHRDINVNAKHPGGGGAALHLVAEFGHMRFAKLLIELGADVNGRSERLVRNPVVLPPYNQTPLHLAFAKGHDDLVNLLLENGADPKAKDSRGKIPVEYSESNRAN